MIRFEMDVLAADQVERTIDGVIVPYGEVGRIAGVDYRFLPGSVKTARSRTPLLVDHDRSRPVGVLERLEETEHGATARFRVDGTDDGTRVLAQAASGSRGGLSIGATVEASVENEDGVLDVTAGLVHEVSLVALGAFAGAEVTSVAAEQEEPEPAEPEPEPDPNQTELPVDDPDDPAPAEPADPEEGTMTEATAPPVMITAERSRAPELNAGQYVDAMLRAQAGDRDAVRLLEAALTETISTDLTGLLPPNYERTVIGGKQIPRPLYETFRSRPIPGVGLQVVKPKWTTLPAGAWAATVDADATTSKAVIGTQAATVLRWDWATAISWAVVQRSDPAVIDEVYGQAVQNFYDAVELKVAGQLLAGQPGTSTTLGAAFGEYWTACKKTPDVVIAAPDVWGKLADAHALNTSVAAGTPSAGSGALVSSFAGVPVIVSGNIGATKAVLATRRAVDARTTEPVRLTANAIGALNVELAVVGEGLFDNDWPTELLVLTAVVPGTAAAKAK